MSTVHVGVAWIRLAVPGSRSLKDRRQAVRSLSDRIRHRFGVSVTELPEDAHASATLVLTSASADARLLRSVLDQCVALARSSGLVVPTQVDVDVSPWHPRDVPTDWDVYRWSDDG